MYTGPNTGSNSYFFSRLVAAVLLIGVGVLALAIFNMSNGRPAVSMPAASPTCTPLGVQSVWQDGLGQVIAQDIYSFLYLWDGAQFKKTGTSGQLYDYKETTINGHVYKVTGLYEITVDGSKVVQLCS